MLVRLLAALLLLALLFWLFRLAMGLRWAKVERERARRLAEGTGRRVVAELPLEEGVVLVAEDARTLFWGQEAVAKRDLDGARLLLNSAVAAAVARDGAWLPAPPAAEEAEGRERWEVALYLRDGSTRLIRCGSVREGISRQAARAVFDAVRRATLEGEEGRP